MWGLNHVFISLYYHSPSVCPLTLHKLRHSAVLSCLLKEVEDFVVLLIWFGSHTLHSYSKLYAQRSFQWCCGTMWCLGLNPAACMQRSCSVWSAISLIFTCQLLVLVLALSAFNKTSFSFSWYSSLEDPA